MSDNTVTKAVTAAETSSAPKLSKEETTKLTSDVSNNDGTSTSKSGPGQQQSFGGLASGTGSNVFSMFGGAKKERKEEVDDTDEPSGSSKKKAPVAADDDVSRPALDASRTIKLTVLCHHRKRARSCKGKMSTSNRSSA